MTIPIISTIRGRRRSGDPPSDAPLTSVFPSGAAELAESLADATRRGDRLSIAGRGHSLGAADPSGGYLVSEGLLIRTTGLSRLLDVDREAGTVTVGAGMTLRTLGDRLGARGLTLDNPGDVDVHTLGGVLAAGMYGCGGRFGSLASQVVALDLMCVDGTVLHCSPDSEPELFAAAKVSVGALGVVTEVTMRAVPGFNVAARHCVEPLEDVVASVAGELAGCDYFECRWFPSSDQVAVRRRYRTAAPPGGRGELAWLWDQGLGKALGSGGAVALAQRWPTLVPSSLRLAAVAGRRNYCDRSCRVLSEWRVAGALEAVWALPLDAVGQALADVADWHRRSEAQGERPVLSGPVITSVGLGDEAWMSGSYGRNTGIVAVPLVPGARCAHDAAGIAELMVPLGGRPRWGSVHPLGARELAPLYPRWDDWQAQRRRVDPHGRLVSSNLGRILGPVR